MEYTWKKSLIACAIGNTIEWYDYGLFIFISPILAHVFFPPEDKLNGLLSTFLVFAIGFVVRPLGSLCFGHFGDRIGRAKTLKASIYLISLSTMGMALLPSYEQVGSTAVIGLIVMRLLQGFSIGGEFSGSMIYLAEIAPDKHRALLSCMTNNGSNLGILIAVSASTLLAQVFTEAQMQHYAWRFLFLFAGVFGLIGLKCREMLVETQVFLQARIHQDQAQLPIRQVLRVHKRDMVRIAFILLISACGSYTLMNYISTYCHVFLQMPLAQALQLETVFILMTFFFVPTAAIISDRIGRRLVLGLATMGYLIFAVPCFYWLGHSSSPAWLSLLPLVIFYSMEQAVTPVMIVENFPVVARYTGVSLAYNLTFALIGGTAPYVNAKFIHLSHDRLVPAYYLSLCAALTLLCVLRFSNHQFGESHPLTN